MEGEARVCPRCGHRAGESRYCPGCGLNIARQRELPTRAQWRLRRGRRSGTHTRSYAVAVAAVAVLGLAVGAYLLGDALAENREETRAAAKRAYEAGFEKGRHRGYRTTYDTAREEAETSTAPTPEEPSVSSSPTACGTVEFTPNSDDVTTSITPTGVDCAEAEEVVRAVRGGASAAAGFTCESTEYPSGQSGQGMAETVYECVRGGARIEWSSF